MLCHYKVITVSEQSQVKAKCHLKPAQLRLTTRESVEQGLEQAPGLFLLGGGRVWDESGM